MRSHWTLIVNNYYLRLHRHMSTLTPFGLVVEKEYYFDPYSIFLISNFPKSIFLYENYNILTGP